MKRIKFVVILGTLLILSLLVSSCFPFGPRISLTVQTSNREPGKPIEVKATSELFTPSDAYTWKLEKFQSGWVDISGNLKVMSNDTAVVYLPTSPETGEVRITARANGLDAGGLSVQVESSRTISYKPLTPVLVEVFEEVGASYSEPSSWFNNFSFFFSNRVPTFVRYRENYLEPAAVGFDPFAQRLLTGIDPTSKTAIYDGGEVYFQAWSSLPKSAYSNAQMSSMFNSAQVSGDWNIRIRPYTFSGWRATGWTVSVENIDRFTDDLWLFRARKSDNLATHFVKLNSYYDPTATDEEFESEAVGTYVNFTFNENSIVGPANQLWGKDYYFGVIVVERSGTFTEEFGEAVEIVAFKGSSMVLFADKNW